MSSTVAEIACAALVTLSFLGSIIALMNNAWEMQDLSTASIPVNAKYNGLWMRCEPDTSSRIICWRYKSFFLGLSTEVQAGRAFTITAVAFGLFASCLCFISISAVRCSSKVPAVRNRIRQCGSVLSLLAGISIIVGASWYASELLRKYYDDVLRTREGERMVLGEAIFIAWSAGVLYLVGALSGMCISCHDSDEEEVEQPRGFYPMTRISKEYV